MKQARGMVMGLTLLLLLGSACSQLVSTPEPPGTSVDLPSDVEAAVRQAVSARTGADADQIAIVAVEEEEWPNACLGLAEEGEACAQVITPGYEVTVQVGGETHVFRTDEKGTAVRQER